MADINVIVAAVGVGLIAGLFLDIVGFLLVVVTPTILALSLAAILSSAVSGWIVPIAWVAQQAAYLFVLHLVRPRACRHVLARVRIMMKL